MKKKKTPARKKALAGKKPQKLNPARKRTASKSKERKSSSAPEKKISTIQEKKDEGILPFPVVAIGASAGGQEAFSTFLEHLPPNLGMAYIYIQHLSPDHQSFLPQILQRKTKMPVVSIKNKMVLQKDHVYIMPEKNILSVADGHLLLQKPTKAQAAHSVDHFLSSLAHIYQQNAIGIVLSGTGTDGTIGLTAIKAEGGITFAQDNSARYTSMPQHAFDMGHVDFIMPPDKIAQELSTLIKHPYAVTTANDFLEQHQDDMRKIRAVMHNRKGVDFSHYKQTTIHRRIMRRMALNRLKDLKAYAELLKGNKEETDALYHDLLIAVTDFFRDPVMYQALSTKVLPALLRNRKHADPIRIWIPGCATGEEAVSFAIILLEYLGEKAISTQIQIFATDLNEKAIERARSGMYLKAALHNVSPQRLDRFFVKSEGRYQVIKSIRDMCIFAPHNLLKDPPFSRMDVISCQNLLIYLEAGPQSRIMHSFHYALKPTGFLLLGKSETIGSATDLFDQASKQYKIYTKRQVSRPLKIDFSTRQNNINMDYPMPEEKRRPEQSKESDLEKETDKLLLKSYVPASVVINKNLEIVRFRGSTSSFIEPVSGRASLHLLKMIREELLFDLRLVIQKARKEGRPARRDGIAMGQNGTSQEISIEVTPIKNNGRGPFYLVVFKEQNLIQSPALNKKNGASSSVADKRILSLQAQLKEARESLRIITEDFESARDELQSANEEILSSNEELQSINEELETSKEELQSTNEELTTINDELHLRNIELKEAADYTKAVIETMHESLLMLTPDLKVKAANMGFYLTFKVTPEETEGRSLYDLGNGQLDIPELRKQLKMVQSRNIPFTNFEVIQDFPLIGNKCLLLNAHTFQLKEGGGNMILLAIQDLTERKRMEITLKENEERLRLMVQNASDIITVFDQDGTIQYESPAIETMLGYPPQERLGRNIGTDPIIHPEDRKKNIELLNTAISRPGENVFGEFRLRHKDGAYRNIDAIFRSLLEDKKINGIIANYRDVTQRKLLESQKDEFIGVASHELKTPVTSIKAYAQILEQGFLRSNDKKSAELLGKMNTQVDRLTTLIIDLLDFTRIEGGSLQFRKEDYDVNDLINEVVEDVQRISPKHKITKKLGRSVILNGDRYRTGQVITNLLSNAIKYSPNQEKIVVTSEIGKNNFFTVGITDFGIGIEQQLLEKVFDRFFRVSESSLNTFPGLGLGLYIAAEIVKKQGGHIWATSSKGKGSTFYFSLPINK